MRPYLIVDDEDIRRKLRRPQGLLLKDFSDALSKAKSARNRGLLIVSVGDRTTINFLSWNFVPDLCIIDGREMRREAPPVIESIFKRVLSATNPPGTINMEIAELITKALKTPPTLIKVNGEEDLLTLLVCVVAPEKTVVFYGQPRSGVVMIRLDEGDRRRLRRIMDKIVDLNKMRFGHSNFYPRLV